jgi:multiple sugar transport system substrate-binding protein
MALPLDSTFTSGFIRFSQPPAMWNGRVYAYPWTVDTRVLWVNTDLVAASGWKKPITTLDDLLAASEQVHSRGSFGFGANGADVHRLYKKILPFMWTLGGDVLDEGGRPHLNSEANIKALTLYADLARTGFIETQRQLDAAFLSGKVAFWISGSWLIPRVRSLAKFRAEAQLLPGINSQPGISFAGGEYLAVSRATRNQQRARELVKFLTEPEQAMKLCSAIPEAGFPSARIAYQHESLISDTLKAVFARQLDNARMTPVHARWLDLESIIENATVRVLLGEETPQESLEKAQLEALLSVTEQ